jgi:hypothetical protein
MDINQVYTNTTSNFRTLIYIPAIFLLFAIIGYFIYGLYYLSEDRKVANVTKTSVDTDTRELETYNALECTDKFKDNYLSDFYIASSAMSFLVGKQKFDYCNIEMIKNCLLLGARYLELEILGDSLGANPTAVVTTGINQGQWQTSLNSLNFETVCMTILNYAFNKEVKTHNLPLFIYLKLRVDNNPKILQNITLTIKKYFPLKSEKELEFGNRFPSNLDPASTKMCNIFNHIIIWSDPTEIKNYNFNKTQLQQIDEYNKTVNQFTPRRLYYKDVGNFNSSSSSNNTPKTPEDIRQNLDELTKSNQTSLTIVYPNNDNESESINYDPEEGWSYGCQFVALNYQSNDSHRKRYFETFATDSIVLKPLVLQRPKKQDNLKSVNSMLPDSVDKKDNKRRHLSKLYDDQPVFLRPYNNPSKVLCIENNTLVLKEKSDGDVKLEDTFLIQPSLNNENDPLRISLESPKFQNYYLAYDNDTFTLYDYRIQDSDPDADIFRQNATFTPLKPLVTSKNNNDSSQDDTDDLVSFTVQGKEKQFMIYHSPSDSIGVKENDDNYKTFAQATFYIYKLPVNKLNNIRQTDGQYVRSDKGLLIKDSRKLLDSCIFDFIPESKITVKIPEPLVDNFIHIKDTNNNYWIMDNNVLKCNTQTPSYKTRFVLKKNKEFTQIVYGGDSKNMPVTLSGDGILRIAYENEINDKNTNFIIAASFTKAQ